MQQNIKITVLPITSQSSNQTAFYQIKPDLCIKSMFIFLFFHIDEGELIKFVTATRTVKTQLAEVGCLSFQVLTEGAITSEIV